MKKDLGVKPFLFPMPVLLVATYGDGDVVNVMPDKFSRSGLHATRSEKVDAPIIEEFPLTLECRVVSDTMAVFGHHIVGEIVGVLAEQSVLDEAGHVDPLKLSAVLYDQMQSGYYAVGEKIGQAWQIGNVLMK